MSMNFKLLYEASKGKVKDAILGMWKDTAPTMYEQYKDQLEAIVKQGVSDNIVVENMAQWEAYDCDDWKEIVNENIWGKIVRDNDGEEIERVSHNYRPFKHQYQSWNALLRDNKSIVVTTGTGSGKTECFMVPLVHNLTVNQTEGVRKQAVEAIFLYPLNALMEDQKARLNDYISLSEKDLKFAVYNGSTPQSGELNEMFKNEIATRDAIRRDKPNILLTNPSMLEYMLLRSEDSGLFTKDLKWIVIDEAHTFNGAAGAELAMLIRRILKACGVEANNVKFATSSATIGGGDDAQNKLKKFISDITGQNKDKIEVISGSRSVPSCQDETIKNKLQKNDFIYLRDLISEGDTIERKLEIVDGLAENEGLRVRLHFYLQALNFGLYLNPTELENGKFKLSTSIPLVEGKIDNRYLDAYYCSKCGAILGLGKKQDDGSWGRINDENRTLEEDAIAIEDNDNDATNSKENNDSFYIGVRGEAHFGKSCRINEENKLIPNVDGNYTLCQVEIKKSGKPPVYKQVHRCPCCDAHGSENFNPTRSFHMSSNFLSRLIAPILLEQSSEAKENPETKPSRGRKYITFADSRQSVAGPSIHQNLETEEVWVTGVLYKELIQAPNQSVITWNKAVELLFDDENADRMFLSFAKDQGDAKKREYCLSALYRVMNKRPAGGKNSPENCGLICTTYPILDKIREKYENDGLPDAIEEFNNLIANQEQMISENDWCDFIKLFIDHNIRSNGSLFFEYDPQKSDYNKKDVNWRNIDINACRKYRTKDDRRRPIDGENNPISDRTVNRFTNLLANLLGANKYSELLSNEKDVVSGVINQLKNDLTSHISMTGRRVKEIHDPYGNVNGLKWVNEKNNERYMNLTQIAFKLYDNEVWFDENLQIPLDTTFKGYSPYPDPDTNTHNVKCVKKEQKLFSGDLPNGMSVKEWWQSNRQDMAGMWNHKLQRILEYVAAEGHNPLYFQAEHTAQVSREVIKDKTEKFKNGEINIMACSTTMEMGVDLGDLDLVVMNNVPPTPASYKQRAGRAGRGNQNKSASVTICGSDATGESAMADPLNGLICRPINPPAITLNSEQLIQRHVNSFLFRKWITDSEQNIAAGNGDNENDRGMELGEFFSNYGRSIENYINRIKEGPTSITPKDYKSILNNVLHDNSLYHQFVSKLVEYETDNDVIVTIQNLISGSQLEPTQLIKNTRSIIENIAAKIDSELVAIKEVFIDAYYNARRNCFNGYGTKLNYDFTSLYRRNLIVYLSTHQFIPNAHMPVGIVDLIIDEREFHKAENPSRDIKVALFEYAPGQRVFIDGATYTIGGVKWNRNFSNVTIKKCSDGHIWNIGSETCPICRKPADEWSGFGRSISMITPTGFYPHSEKSRITNREYMGYKIGTMLLGVGDWMHNGQQRLYNHRANSRDKNDGQNAEILYYNMGYGKGFYVCKKDGCGYAVPVPMDVDANKETETIKSLMGNGHRYRSKECTLDDNGLNNEILRRHIFGGTIQTDFCEIALYEELNQPMRNNKTNEFIATTLGLMLCRSYADEMGYDRNEIDFIVRKQNEGISICVYDTAKGGLGYSNKLDDSTLIDHLLSKIKSELRRYSSVSEILDRQTMKYVDKIDIDSTLKWLQKEEDYRQNVKEEIQNSFENDVRVSSYCDVEHAVKNITANDSCTLFFNGRLINKWNAITGDINWMRNRNLNADDRQGHRIFAVYNAPSQITSEVEQIQRIVSPLRRWTFCSNDIKFFPLAIINGRLFFTTNEECSFLNGNWAANDVYVVEYPTPPQLGDWSPGIIGDEHITIEPNTQINTDKLFELVLDNSPALQAFVRNANGHSLSFKYHEEYMQNHLSMTIAMQFVKKMVETAQATISKCTFVGERYDIDYYNQQQYDVCLNPLKLWINHLNDENRDEYFMTKFLTPLNELYPTATVSVESLDRGALPHWRDLIITDNVTGAKIHILPNGGFANGWTFDSTRAERPYYPNNCDISTPIPIKSNEHPILYDIKVGDL